MRNLYSQLVKKCKVTLSSKRKGFSCSQIRLAETFYNKDYILFMRGMYPTQNGI